MESTGNKKFFDHMLEGLNAMIPFVVAGGILMAIGFAVSGADAMSAPEDGLGTLGQVIYGIGSGHTMSLMFLIVGGFIATSIADNRALLAGMVGGSIAASNGSTFLGAVIGGFLAGYCVKLMVKYIKLPEALNGVYEILIIPVGSTLAVGLICTYVVGMPVAFLMDSLTGLLNSMQGGSLILLCAVLGAMMAVDLCGPILRVAYFFGVAAVVAQPGVPQVVMGAVIAAGMIPPLAMALASTIQKKKFTEQEIEAGKAAWILGASLICEGYIPFAINDPKRVIPACAIGSAVAGVIIALFKTGTTVVHGGIFILPIPGAVENPLGFIVAILAGTITAAAITLILKKPVVTAESQPQSEEDLNV
ncbi:PTS system, fructose-specific IIC component [Eubacterium aggregans]|uniref:PTS system, fructose-specific IIC component n=1 Tax=Eubacterium aggregans TaxID=81409 RepID=A0A1H3WVC0_9FIRM|nr:PTS fructose transporter subunit IIC [Eubacterium aggregans]SDZ90128.1 PTS system, fructose-specific IIC component [Eubacterium aggregans]